MFKQNLAFLLILITYSLYFTCFIRCSPSDFKVQMDSDYELLQKALELKQRNTQNFQSPSGQVLTELEKVVVNNRNNTKAKRTKQNNDEPELQRKRVTINKGMNIAGNINTESINVQDLVIDGKADITLKTTSLNMETKKLTTNNLSIEKIISNEVIFL